MATLTNAAIGTVTFYSIKGLSQPQKQQHDDVSRDNVPGTAKRLLALRGEPGEHRGLLDIAGGNPTTIKAMRDTLLGMIGQIVTFVDDYGISEPNTSVEDVRIPPLEGGNPVPLLLNEGGLQGVAATHRFDVILVLVKKQ